MQGGQRREKWSSTHQRWARSRQQLCFHSPIPTNYLLTRPPHQIRHIEMQSKRPHHNQRRQTGENNNKEGVKAIKYYHAPGRVSVLSHKVDFSVNSCSIEQGATLFIHKGTRVWLIYLRLCSLQLHLHSSQETTEP